MNGKKSGGAQTPPNVQELSVLFLEHLYFIIDAPEESTKKKGSIL